MNRYQVVATLGPASASEDAWAGLLAAGATGFRLNTSHVSLDALEGWLDRLCRFRARRGEAWTVTLDLQGSKWRLGQFAPFRLEEGAVVELLLVEQTLAAETLPVPHADLFQGAQAGMQIALNDAKSLLTVEKAAGERLRARVLRGGWIEPRKGLALPGSRCRAEGLCEQDARVVTLARDLPGLRFAISYLRDGEEMRRYRRQMGGLQLSAKLERAPALADAAGIAAACDAIWLCRGDLGAELGLRGMAEAAAGFAAQVHDLAVPALLAGQVLEHMTHNPTPTRAEVCGIYDALRAGFAGVVLSDETAVGENPAEACKIAALWQE